MRRRYRLNRLLIGSALIVSLSGRTVVAEPAVADLTFVPAAAPTNRLDVVATVVGGFGSDEDTATVTGSQNVELEADFDPNTLTALVSGISFTHHTPGHIAWSDMVFTILGTNLTVTMQDCASTFTTPSPPGPVAGGVFSAADHLTVLNTGSVTRGASTRDLFASPLICTNRPAGGAVEVKAPTIVGNVARYEVSLTFPVDFTNAVAVGPGGGGSAVLAASGLLVATGHFDRVIPPPVVNNDDGASNVDFESADLNGMLVATSAALTEVFVYWGTNNGGTVKADWKHVESFGVSAVGPLSTNVTGLVDETKYFYRYYATNQFGEDWAPSAEIFTTFTDFGAFEHRMRLGFSGYQKNERLTNFPALIRLSESLACFRYDQFASPVGTDLRFSDSNGVVSLNYEIENWNTNGDSAVWVQLPVLTSNTCIFAYWGNTNLVVAPAAPDTLTGLQLWLRADEGVVTNTAGEVSSWQDQSGVGNDVSQASSSKRPTQIEAALNGRPAVRFSRNDEQQLDRSAPILPSGTDARTLFMVVQKITQAGTAYPLAYGNNASNETFAVDLEPNIRVVGYANDFDTGLDSDTRPHIYAVVYDGTNVTPYADGGAGATVSRTYATALDDLHIGNFTAGSYYYDGDIGDILVYNRALSEKELNGVGFYLERQYDLDTLYQDPAAALSSIDGSVWSESFEAVYHLAEEPAGGGTFKDSALQHNGRFVHQTGGSDAAAEGRVDGAMELSGISVRGGAPEDYVDLPDGFADFTGGLTFSVWALPHTVKDWARFIEVGQGEADDEVLFGRQESTGNLWYEVRYDDTGQVVAASGAIGLDQWQMFTVTHDGQTDQVTLYKNGAAVGSGTVILPKNELRTVNFIGNSAFGTDDEFDGVLDEVRLSAVDRSSNWVWATYRTTAANDLFTDYGEVEGISLPLISNGHGATDIGPSSATLNGFLSCTGDSPAVVRLYYGATDGGTVATNWNSKVNFGVQPPGVLSQNVGSLAPDTTYFYRYYASNTTGEAWAPWSALFKTVISFDDWAFKLKVTFDGYNKNETLTNFPALVVLNEGISSFRYNQFASASGSDLRFSAANGTTELNYEIEAWNTNGDSYIWVQVPVLSDDGCIFAYWGNALATNPPAYTGDGSTWTEGYEAVLHLNDDLLDSSGNEFDGTNFGSTDTTGRIADGQDFDMAGTQSVDCGGGLDIANKPFTVSAWAKRGVTGSSAEGYLISHGMVGPPDGQGLHFGFRGGEFESDLFTFAFWGDDLNSSAAYADNSAYHLWTGTFDTKTRTQRLYRDGNQVDSRVADLNYQGLPGASLRIGARFGDGYFDGGIDEVRVSGIDRSSNWVCAAYLTAAEHESFTTYGFVEGAPFPLVSNDGGASDVHATSATLNGELLTTGAAPTQVSVFWGASDGGTDKEAWAQEPLGVSAEGPLSTVITGLAPNTIYYYRFYSTNAYGESWAESAANFTTLPPDLNPNDYCYRIKISFPGYMRAETLSGFPALVVFNESLANFSYTNFADVNAGDLRFTDANATTELSYEIEDWNTNGDSFVWVRVPALRSNACIYAYWANTNAVAPAPSATNGMTWMSGYQGVWHFHDDVLDATANGLDGINMGSVDTSGQIADAQDFVKASSNAVHVGPGLEISNRSFSVSAWAKRASSGTADGFILSHGMGGPPDRQGLHFGFRGGGEANTFTFAFWADDLNVSNAVFADTVDWHLWAATYDAGSKKQTLYRDGVEVGSRFASANYQGAVASLLRIGEFLGGGFFDGGLDEIRVSAQRRSSNWVWASWANQLGTASTFNAYAAVQDVKALNGDTDGDGLDDGWELDNFGRLTNANAFTDGDLDDFIDLAEFIAGTDPNDDLSYFAIDGISLTSPLHLVFESVSGRVYGVDYNSNLLNGAWSVLQSDLPGTNGMLSVTDTNSAPQRSYRVNVRLE